MDVNGQDEHKKGIELNQQIVTDVIADFMQQLRDDQKSIPLSHFAIISPEMVMPDEVKLVCPGQLELVTARNYRSQLQELFRTRTHKIVRITTDIRLSEIAGNDKEKVLSKGEMFEAMISKNPLLLKLKDSLGMQLEL